MTEGLTGQQEKKHYTENARYVKEARRVVQDMEHEARMAPAKFR